MVFMVAHVLWEISFFDWKKLKEEEIFNSSRPPPPLTQLSLQTDRNPPHHLMGGKKKKFSMWRPFLLFVCVSLYEAAPSYRRIPEMGEWLIWLAFLWGRRLVYYAYSFETTSSSMLTTEWKKKRKTTGENKNKKLITFNTFLFLAGQATAKRTFVLRHARKNWTSVMRMVRQQTAWLQTNRKLWRKK